MQRQVIVRPSFWDPSLLAPLGVGRSSTMTCSHGHTYTYTHTCTEKYSQKWSDYDLSGKKNGDIDEKWVSETFTACSILHIERHVGSQTASPPSCMVYSEHKQYIAMHFSEMHPCHNRSQILLCQESSIVWQETNKMQWNSDKCFDMAKLSIRASSSLAKLICLPKQLCCSNKLVENCRGIHKYI